MHISLAAETLFHIGAFPITNTILIAVLTTVVLSAFSMVVYTRLATIPNAAQNALEYAFDGAVLFMESVVGNRKDTLRFFPLVMTIFIAVLLSNLVEIIPGLGTVGLVEITHGKRTVIPFLRSASADLNFTIAVAVSAIIGVQILGITTLGFFTHWKKFFFPPWEKPYLVGSFIGILELIAETAKIVSFSFRLFGNIFAGEVLLTVTLFLLPYLVPLPFLFLEVFVGFIQAVVFSMLTLVFLKVATAHH